MIFNHKAIGKAVAVNFNYKIIGITILIIGLLITVFCAVEFIFNSTEMTLRPIKPDVWSQFGDVIGGVVGTMVALVGVFLLFETLRQQRNSFIKQQVETRFFELLRLHRENVAEMQSKGKTGRNVFIEIKDEFHELYDAVKISGLRASKAANSKERKNLVQIAYLIVYFGVNNSSTEYLKDKISSIIDNKEIYEEFRESFLEELIIDHGERKIINDSKSKAKKNFLKFDGHQIRLGHYYRHLFQTVKFINNQPRQLFSYEEKYEYIKTLRAQLGTHEQALFLYNSISPLGEDWELSPAITDVNEKLITKYNLIKNIPNNFTREIEPKDYFPNIQYEFDDQINHKREELIKRYI